MKTIISLLTICISFCLSGQKLSLSYLHTESEILTSSYKETIFQKTLHYDNGLFKWKNCYDSSLGCIDSITYSLEQRKNGIYINILNNNDSLKILLFSFSDTIEMLDLEDLNNSEVKKYGISWFEGNKTCKINDKHYSAFIFVHYAGKKTHSPTRYSRKTIYIIDSLTLIPLKIISQRVSLVTGEIDNRYTYATTLTTPFEH